MDNILGICCKCNTISVAIIQSVINLNHNVPRFPTKLLKSFQGIQLGNT